MWTVMELWNQQLQHDMATSMIVKRAPHTCWETLGKTTMQASTQTMAIMLKSNEERSTETILPIVLCKAIRMPSSIPQQGCQVYVDAMQLFVSVPQHPNECQGHPPSRLPLPMVPVSVGQVGLMHPVPPQRSYMKEWWRGKFFLLTVGAFLLTVKLLCFQSLKALVRSTFPL